MTYIRTQFESVIRAADGLCIPASPKNRDYAEYLDWVAKGNTPDPYVPPPEPAPDLAKQIAVLEIDQPTLLREAILGDGDALKRLREISDQVAALKNKPA